MVVGVFPALKLGMLLIKQISKPLAQMFVNQAKNHPVFRTYFIIPPAQFYHWAEVKGKMYLMNLGKPTKVAKLNEAMAIELGANLMGEVIIFSIAGGCIMLEYSRQAAKEAKKEEVRLAQIQQFTNDIESLYGTTLRQEVEIRRLESVVNQLASRAKITLPRDTGYDVKSSGDSEPEAVQEKHCATDDKSNNRTDSLKKGNVEHSQSLVDRAIVYFENDVRRDKLS
ncbi:optic atrophy 3 protein homolog [Neodiprion pinetum]|uniref:OPA3-like protein CG13603 n=1 Tax=Neodiprion lecontei TaxID=441921 RepID=A0A6J0BWL9_NEOLC|nr:putative OPA3-like protein CG13603 [Neodiprion lecontei]XP_046490793.1 putative OPA3-like protein CG13603 [Neodiprion pinetum]